MAEVSADDISLINYNQGPYILLSTRTVLDSPPGGNNNGRFDPGETGGLIVALRNIGNQGVDNVSAKLRSSDNRFVITDSISSYGSIPAGATRTNETDPFGIQVDHSIPIETPVTLQLFVNGTGYNDTLRFNIVVGELRATDPIPDNSNPPRYWAYDDVDTLYPQHPIFSWIEINNRGTRLSLSDDQTVTIDLPFTWQFYGSTYTQISICSNGWVAPGYTTTTSYTNTALPSTSIPGAICLNWDDLYPPVGNGVWYYYDSDNHRFIVEWDSVHYFPGSSAPYERFQLILYDPTIPTPTGDNLIVAQYLTANQYTSSTIGIQDPTQTIAIQCLFDNTYHRGTAPLVPGRAIKYTTADPTAITETPETYPRNSTLNSYPNPSRGPVKFTSNLASTATLTIYDRTGRLVQTVSGKGNWYWDGKDAQGRVVPPGVYFCRMDTPEVQAEVKFVIAR
ncbi:T9SS type A sorting domain-containing protein [candidate division WOR-3 bacterium]|nr:T9SS type A sorting domain-containing protein [candidate division WOR-3 bacterium]